MSEQTEPIFEPAKKIEDFLIGLLDFGQNFLRTIWHLIRKKQQFSTNHDSGVYAKPVTFLTLMSFVSLRIFRYGLLVFLVALANVSCSRETRTNSTLPLLQNELTIPTLSEIFLYGIPMLLAAFLASRFLQFVMLKRTDEAQKAKEQYENASYYSVGMLYIICVTILPLMLFILARLDDLFGNAQIWGFDPIIVISIALTIAWGTRFFIRLTSMMTPSEAFRIEKKRIRTSIHFICTFLMISIILSVGAILTYFLAQTDVEKFQSKPLLATGYLASEESDGNTFSLSVLIENNSNSDLVLVSDAIRVYGDKIHAGVIQDSATGNAPIVHLEPNEVDWIEIDFEHEGESYESGLFQPQRNLIEFTVVTSSGKRKTVSSYAMHEEKAFSISTIE